MKIKGINEIVICNLWYWNLDYAVEAVQILDRAKLAASPVGTTHVLAAVTAVLSIRFEVGGYLGTAPAGII